MRKLDIRFRFTPLPPRKYLRPRARYCKLQTASTPVCQGLSQRRSRLLFCLRTHLHPESQKDHMSTENFLSIQANLCSLHNKGSADTGSAMSPSLSIVTRGRPCGYSIRTSTTAVSIILQGTKARRCAYGITLRNMQHSRDIISIPCKA